MKKFIGHVSVLIVGFSNSAVAFDNKQLIALNNSDIAGTCWKYSYSGGVVKHKFNSNGTYERISTVNAQGSSNAGVIIFKGNWKISSNEIWENITYTSLNGSGGNSYDKSWSQSFVVRNGQLVSEGRYVFTLGCN